MTPSSSVLPETRRGLRRDRSTPASRVCWPALRPPARGRASGSRSLQRATAILGSIGVPATAKRCRSRRGMRCASMQPVSRRGAATKV